jgi:hypothetical protein
MWLHTNSLTTLALLLTWLHADSAMQFFSGARCVFFPGGLHGLWTSLPALGKVLQTGAKGELASSLGLHCQGCCPRLKDQHPLNDVSGSSGAFELLACTTSNLLCIYHRNSNGIITLRHDVAVGMQVLPARIQAQSDSCCLLMV